MSSWMTSCRRLENSASALYSASYDADGPAKMNEHRDASVLQTLTGPPDRLRPTALIASSCRMNAVASSSSMCTAASSGLLPRVSLEPGCRPGRQAPGDLLVVPLATTVHSPAPLLLPGGLRSQSAASPGRERRCLLEFLRSITARTPSLRRTGLDPLVELTSGPSGRSCADAHPEPASSIRSIALSGRKRSEMFVRPDGRSYHASR